MAQITITPIGSGSVSFNTNSIISLVQTYGSTGTDITYSKNGDKTYIVSVVETPATIFAQCNNLILVDTVNGSQYIYINGQPGDGILNVDIDPNNASGSIITWMCNDWAFPKQIISTDSVSTIQGRINTALGTEPTISFIYSSTDSIVAYAGGGQTNAVPLTTEVNFVTTVATAGDSVKLAPAQQGLRQTVINQGANSLDIYPSVGGQIGSLGVNNPYILAAGSQVTFNAQVNGEWTTSSITVVAATGTTQGTAASLGSVLVTNVTSSGGTAIGVQLESDAVNGDSQTVNNLSAQIINIYPQSGQQINALGVNIPYALAVGAAITFTGNGTGQWTTSEVNGLTAHAGGGQVGATPLPLYANFISVAATTGDSVILNPASVGALYAVFNNGANSINIYPAIGEQIGTQAINTPYVLASGSSIQFSEASLGIWASVSATSSSVPIQNTANTGTAGTDVTSVEYGDGFRHTTILTLTNVPLAAVTGAAAQAVGAVVYTLPAGIEAYEITSMSVALQAGVTGNKTLTPHIGIGTVIATGAVATLAGTATFEDIIVQQTAANANGTATVATLVPTAGIPLITGSAGSKAVNLNIAATWTAADTVTATGTITLQWSTL